MEQIDGYRVEKQSDKYYHLYSVKNGARVAMITHWSECWWVLCPTEQGKICAGVSMAEVIKQFKAQEEKQC